MSDVLPKKKPFSLINTVIVISVLTMVAKVAGFAEKLVIAHYFGTDASADIYFATTGVVLSIVFLVKELVHPSLVPVLTKTIKNDPKASAVLIRRFLKLSGVFLVLLGIIATFFSFQLTTVFAPGFSSGKKVQMSLLLRYLSPACIFLSLSMITYSILNAYKKFMRAAVSETAYKMLVLAGLFVLIPILGLKAVPLVLSLAAVILFISMLVCIPEKGWHRVETNTKPDNLNSVFRLMGPIAIGVIFSHLSGLVDNMLASTLPTGHLSYLGYSKKLIDAILLIGPVALVTVSYPYLAGLSHQSKKEYVELFVKVLRILIYMGIPSIIMIIALREPIIRFLFERGRFGPDSTAGTSRALFIYGLGFLTFAIESHLVYSFYSFSDTKTPVTVGVGCVVLDIILAVSLIHVMGYTGIASAFVVSKSIKVVVLGLLLEKRLSFLKHNRLILFLIKTIMATIPAVLILLYLRHINAGTGLISVGAIDLLLPAIGFVLTFVIFSMFLGIKEIWQLKQLVYDRMGVRKKS